MKLDLVMRQFTTFDCGRGTMFTFCIQVASKYVGLMVIGTKRNLQPKIKPQSDPPHRRAHAASLP